MSSIRIAIMGAPKVGKSTYIGRWFTGEFKGQDEQKMVHNTSIGKVLLTMSSKPEFLDKADAVIIMFDSSKESKKIASDIEVEIKSQMKPYIMVQSKGDNRVRNSTCIVFSSKNHYNFEKPVLFLLRKHFKDQNLQFKQNDAMIPEELIL